MTKIGYKCLDEKTKMQVWPRSVFVWSHPHFLRLAYFMQKKPRAILLTIDVQSNKWLILIQPSLIFKISLLNVGYSWHVANLSWHVCFKKYDSALSNYDSYIQYCYINQFYTYFPPLPALDLSVAYYLIGQVK